MFFASISQMDWALDLLELTVKAVRDERRHMCDSCHSGCGGKTPNNPPPSPGAGGCTISAPNTDVTKALKWLNQQNSYSQ